MCVESDLSRKLGITFIDARSVATEAKLALGIHCYPSDEQKEQIIEEAVKIFQQSPDNVRDEMRLNHESLEAVCGDSPPPRRRYNGDDSSSSLENPKRAGRRPSLFN